MMCTVIGDTLNAAFTSEPHILLCHACTIKESSEKSATLSHIIHILDFQFR